MLKFLARLALAASLAVAPLAAHAQAAKEPANPAEIQAQAEQAIAAPTADYPLSVDFNLADDPDDILYLDLSTGERVAIRLVPQWAPHTVARIKTLARQGFYNGVIFHRVIDGFMAQTGDPTGTGKGGSQLPDLASEFNMMPHVRGTVSMARAEDENSANSQFFIVFYPRFRARSALHQFWPRDLQHGSGGSDPARRTAREPDQDPAGLNRLRSQGADDAAGRRAPAAAADQRRHAE